MLPYPQINSPGGAATLADAFKTLADLNALVACAAQPALTAGGVVFGGPAGTFAQATSFMWNSALNALTVSGNVIAGAFVSSDPNFVMHSRVTINGGAADHFPTMVLGPFSGNPTKWLPYDDNGVTRYIPSWSNPVQKK